MLLLEGARRYATRKRIVLAPRGNPFFGTMLARMTYLYSYSFNCGHESVNACQVYALVFRINTRRQETRLSLQLATRRSGRPTSDLGGYQNISRGPAARQHSQRPCVLSRQIDTPCSTRTFVAQSIPIVSQLPVARRVLFVIS